MGQTDIDRPPYFFLSYAHDSPEEDEYVRGLHTKLSNEVRLRAGLPQGRRVGFCDADLQAGVDWSANLVEQLCTAQVFLAILTPRYFRSAGCGKEWTVFTRRLRMGSARPNESPLIPLLWLADMELPPIVQAYQYRDPGFGEAYAQDGLRDLIRLQVKHRDTYPQFVTALAHRIVRLNERSRVPAHTGRPAFDEVADAFATQPDNGRGIRTVPLARKQGTRDRPLQSDGSGHLRPTWSGLPRLNPADPMPKDEPR